MELRCPGLEFWGVGSGVFYICCSGGLNQSLAMLAGRGVAEECACAKVKRLSNIRVSM